MFWEGSVGAPYSDTVTPITVYSERHMEPPETDAERETWSVGAPAREVVNHKTKTKRT